MKSCVRFLYSVAVFVALFFASFTNLTAQTTAQNIGTTSERSSVASPAAPVAEPYKVGETLTYEAKYSRLLLRGIDVADLTFSVVEDKQNTPNKVKFQAEAVSKGGLLNIIRYSFLQKFDSTVQTDDFRILQTVRYDEQDKRIRNSEANFDYSTQKLTYREVDPNNPMSPPRIISSPLETPVQDLVSAVYYLRRLPLALNKQFTIRLSDSGVIYDVPIKVTAREQVKTVLGKVWTLRVEPEIFGERRPLEGEGSVTIWVTDDARRLPVRSQIHSKIGKIEIKLRKADGVK